MALLVKAVMRTAFGWQFLGSFKGHPHLQGRAKKAFQKDARFAAVTNTFYWGDKHMEGKKSYKLPKGYIFSTIYDIIELQNGELILSDTRHGRIHYQVAMYGYVWELLYVVTDIGISKTDVTLRIIGERKDNAKEIRREFALLDSMLEGGAVVQLTCSAIS